MRAAAALAVASLAGCAVAPAPPPAAEPPAARVVDAPEPPPVVQPVIVRPVVVPAPDEAQRALAYFDRVRRLQGAELVREYETVRAAYNRLHEDADRMRLAMIHSLPNTTATDESRAVELLDAFVKTPAHALHHVAVLLTTFVQEQRRLGLAAQGLTKDVQGLQQKLDALRSLERALTEREGAPRRR